MISLKFLFFVKIPYFMNLIYIPSPYGIYMRYNVISLQTNCWLTQCVASLCSYVSGWNAVPTLLPTYESK